MSKNSLKTWYESLNPKAQLKAKTSIIALCDISEKTFYNYLNGVYDVPKLTQKAISSIAKKPTNKLFTKKTKITSL